MSAQAPLPRHWLLSLVFLLGISFPAGAQDAARLAGDFFGELEYRHIGPVGNRVTTVTGVAVEPARLPLPVVSLVLFAAAVVLLISDRILSGLEVDGFVGAIVAAIAIGVVHWLIAFVLGLLGLALA